MSFFKFLPTRHTARILLDTFGAFLAAVGVAIGLWGLLERRENFIWFMVDTVFAYAALRLLSGFLEIIWTPREAHDLHFRVWIVVVDTLANFIATLGVGIGLLGLLNRSEGEIWAMVILLFLYAFMILLRGALEIENTP